MFSCVDEIEAISDTFYATVRAPVQAGAIGELARTIQQEIEHHALRRITFCQWIARHSETFLVVLGSSKFGASRTCSFVLTQY
jgi:hypothetical protein